MLSSQECFQTDEPLQLSISRKSGMGEGAIQSERPSLWNLLTCLFPEICKDSKALGPQLYRERQTFEYPPAVSAGPLPSETFPSNQKCFPIHNSTVASLLSYKETLTHTSQAILSSLPWHWSLARLPQSVSISNSEKGKEKKKFLKAGNTCFKYTGVHLKEIVSCYLPSIMTKFKFYQTKVATQTQETVQDYQFKQDM